MLFWKDCLWFLAAGVDYEAQASGPMIGPTMIWLIGFRGMFFVTAKSIKSGRFLGCVG